MSMRFRRGAIRARDIDGEPAAVKLQVSYSRFVSVPAVPRLKARPRSSTVLSTAIFFAIDELWTSENKPHARENPIFQTRSITNVARYIYPVENFKASWHTPSTTRIRFLHRILFSRRSSDIYDTLIFLRIYFDKFKHYFFFRNYFVIIIIPFWTEFDRVENDSLKKEKKKKKQLVFSVQQRAHGYKFLLFGTEVCQASTTVRILLLQSWTSYRRNLLLHLDARKFK